MRAGQKEQAPKKVAPLLEWQTCDSDTEWQTLQVAPGSTTPDSATVTPPSWVVRHWRKGALLIALLAGIGGWTWHLAQQGLTQLEAEVRESVEVDLWTTPQNGLETDASSTIAEIETLHPLTSTVQMLALTGETAIVRVVIQPGPQQPALRQTRVYQRTNLSWKRIAPTRALWGSPRSLQTNYFDFHYYAQDEEAVTAAAAIMDEIYSSISANFQSSRTAGVKIRIEVDPTQIYGSIAMRPNYEAPLVVASPATYLAPVELSEADLLVQSVVLSLLSESEAQTIEDHGISPLWQPVLHGLLLWELWKVDLPLSSWREPLVKWIMEAENWQEKISYGEPRFYLELCALHQLYMTSPEEIHIPVYCDDPTWTKTIVPLWQVSYKPPLTLAQLIPSEAGPLEISPLSRVHFGSAVATATLVEYIVDTYGQAMIPRLLASSRHHKSWETLVPAVFALSAVDFEAGWQSYLALHYNVSPEQ